MREALIAAALTGMMILLFLGSWRSTLIVCISIPLSILASLCILSLLGQTINVMTLGGLALAVGILVDDATVAIENTHRNIGMRKPLVRAVIDGAAQIAIPTFVSTLAICIVFVPVLLLTGTAQLFVHAAGHGRGLRHAGVLLPVAHAGSDHGALSAEVRSRPVPARHRRREPPAARASSGASTIVFNGLFERLRFRYIGLLDWSLRHRGRVLAAFRRRLRSPRSAWSGWWARTSSPTSIPARCGCMRAPRPARASKKPRCASPRSSAKSAHVIPANEIDTLIDNIGIPNSWTSLAQGDIPTISSADGEILISLNKEKHGSTPRLRSAAPQAPEREIPGHDVLLPAGQHHQPDSELRTARAHRSAGGRPRRRWPTTKSPSSSPRKIARIPGAADVHVHQVVDQPEIRLNVDRVKAGQLGLTQRDVTSNMLISLSGNNTVAPNFWVNWANGVNYNVGVQTPQYKIDSLDALLRTPVSAASNVVNSTTAGSPGGRPPPGMPRSALRPAARPKPTAIPAP